MENNQSPKTTGGWPRNGQHNRTELVHNLEHALLLIKAAAKHATTRMIADDLMSMQTTIAMCIEETVSKEV